MTTTQLCTTRTSIDCVEDAEITLYSVILQADQPVSIVHGSSQQFDGSGYRYRAWVDKAKDVRLLCEFTCNDGGVDEGFRVVLMRGTKI